MGIAIVATIYNKSKLAGYRLLDTNTRQVNDVTYSSVKGYLSSGKLLLNAKLASGKVMGSGGCSLSDLAKVDMSSKKLMGSDKYLILELISGSSFTCTNYGGSMIPISWVDIQQYDKLGRMANMKPLVESKGREAKLFTNRKISEEEAKGFVNDRQAVIEAREKAKEITQAMDDGKSKVNTPERVDKTEEKKEKTVKNVMLGPAPGKVTVESSEGKRLDNGIFSAPSIDINGNTYSERVNELDSVTGFTVNQKMARGVLVLKAAKIFYYSLYASLKKIPVENPELVSTMGVTADTMYFNPEFVKGLTIAEVPFLLIHEILHIAFKHGLRGEGKNHKLYNMAADLYINKYIADEFGCYPGKGAVAIPGDKYNNGIEFCTGGLFSPDINIDKDTADSIYNKLLDEMETNKSKFKASTSGDSGDQGSGGGSQSNEDGDGGDDEGDGKSQEDDSGQSSGKSSKGTPTSKSSNGITEIDLGNGMKVRVSDVTYNGKKIGEIVDLDLCKDEKDAKLSKDQLANKANGVLSRAVTTAKLAGAPMDGYLERKILLEMAPKIRWQAILKRYLAKSTQKICTYARPDKRFLARGKILPGPKPLDPDSLSGIKVCIDTSGSIGDTDLGIVLGQIKQLLDTYKADAEVIYWDTSVRTVGKFTTVKELLKVKPGGGGGTDINCIFSDYIDDKKKCKEPAKVILVFTDGYFGEVEEKYATKYGKHCIWIIPEADRGNFKRTCGTVAVF